MTCVRSDRTSAGSLTLTASLNVLKGIAEGGGPREGVLVLDYAGCGLGQMDAGLALNAWLSVPLEAALLFGKGDEAKWRRALALLMIDPLLLLAAAGHA